MSDRSVPTCSDVCRPVATVRMSVTASNSLAAGFKPDKYPHLHILNCHNVRAESKLKLCPK
jgi:hypothetical protein